ncbi:similar to Saccharomyces cerevisiae YBR059C AKL1 Ser-Thr protein kinase, member (with Ark1p and Prk1p) of the Ark kinase family [Maudiozyma barnettii]|uniref:Similar to Saccharomyces cerevisiae YBR059C AKL1 Ser-Thr protein kinase, member (With Ark1p and Prk1p) of the Ark kinase family n=1 Tax=Maudiozyma barnettii TaxID=61262 RepID=A0A8H2ZHL1_9SACH|nr:serine/threonine protein kinase AKL1 [Kazachstania barnettii]CAB4255894.1 similar to Saccharomyces cerevisiae YBR059C AKL1 Ser-Thr protein kinase, member (with Ark1p and Prk1p) of the Ark kinase family [Kazachstania barnettii]CAD1784454.1 similar to Saccharomyces cerevisiae YBR059C AKL1 Ser-Thr protein kinase, member (with Ark1p and Prk1p) of the Ark kinase family [Kazachstania barnettii]
MSSSNTTTRSTVGFRSGSGIMNPDFEKFNPGHVVNVGSHKVEIVAYLAEGGFAQIYTVKFIELLNELDILKNDNDTNKKDKDTLNIGDIACLKRVKVNDDNGLSEMKNEIEVMKKLSRSSNIVQYYDSNATKLQNSSAGYEVFLLMELCPNKSLLDFMNDRLASKLSVDEISKIMYDVTLGLSQMHYLTTPLIHRDIKIENVLVDKDNNFKLADFGSTTSIKPIALNDQEIAIATQDIFIHTTPQYRSPEMIDLYRFLPINEPSDIWALGVFLYKLLFYITPFEMTGQFAILHGRFVIPENKYPIEFTNLITAMLMENPHMRPNVYQVLETICKFRNMDVPLFDRYGYGAYNFQTCLDYKIQLNDIQKNLLTIEQSHLMGTSTDLNLYNGIFTNLYEVAPKIDQTESLRVIKQSGERKISDTSYPSGSENKQEIVNIPFNNQNNDGASTVRGNSNNPQKLQSQQQFYQGGVDESRISNDTTYYPSINEINDYAAKEFGNNMNVLPVSQLDSTSNRNSASDGKANFSMLPTITTQSERNINTFFPSGRNGSIHSNVLNNANSNNVTESVYEYNTNNEPTRSSTKGKTHKSNNPFPYFKSEINVSDNGQSSTNYFTDHTNLDQKKRNSVLNPGMNVYEAQSPTTYDAVSPTTYGNLHPPPNLDNIFASTPNMTVGVPPKSNDSRGKQLFRNAVPSTNQNKNVSASNNNTTAQPFQYVPQSNIGAINQDSSTVNMTQFNTQNNNKKLANVEFPDLIDLKETASPTPPPLPQKKRNDENNGYLKVEHKPLDLSINEMSLSPDIGAEEISRDMRRSRSAGIRRNYAEERGGPLSVNNDKGYKSGHDTSNVDKDADNDLMSEESISEMKIPNIKRMIEDDLASEHSSESIDINMDAARRKSSLLKPVSKDSSPSVTGPNTKNHTRNVSLLSENSDIAPLKKFEDTRGNSVTRPGRHSLDLKYEEINFTRRNQEQLDKTLQGIQKVKTNPHTLSSTSNNLQNGNGSTTSFDSKERPLSRVRQSLDIDRLRKDQFGGKSKSSKRSLFSMFK